MDKPMTAGALDGKVAIVTGGGRGIGRAIALGLAAAGARVVATAARRRDEIERLAAEGDGRILPVLADVASDDDCARVVATALGRFGGLHILVNNAGRGMRFVSETFQTEPTRFWQTDPAIWRAIIDTNVNGPFLMARAAVPHMIAQGWGRVINVTMNHATMRRKGFTPYGPSKAALESATAIWAQELDGTGVTVNAVLPGGPTDTGMVPQSAPKTIRDALLDPRIMVPPVAWLASDSADGITGRRLLAVRWDGSIAPSQAAQAADTAAGWLPDSDD